MGKQAHLAGAGQQEARVRALGKSKHVHGTDEARLDRLDGVVPGPTRNHSKSTAAASPCHPDDWQLPTASTFLRGRSKLLCCSHVAAHL